MRGARRRAGHPQRLARHDARLLARPRRATSTPTGRACPASGSTATGRTIDDDGFWYILGRSDDTIKVAGKRVGPAEVESAAVSHPAVAEAAAIGVPDALKGETVVVFVVLRPGHSPTSDALRAAIEAAIVHQLGKSLKPHAIHFVARHPAAPATPRSCAASSASATSTNRSATPRPWRTPPPSTKSRRPASAPWRRRLGPPC